MRKIKRKSKNGIENEREWYKEVWRMFLRNSTKKVEGWS